MKFLARFDGTHLIPSSADSVEAWDKLKRGHEYRVEIREARNPGHHRKAMRLIQDVFENQEQYATMRELMNELKLKCGHYEIHVTTKGRPIYIPLSISFSEMSQDEFEEFYSRLIDVAIEHFGYEGALQYA